MKSASKLISASISVLAEQIMEVERKATGESQGSMIDRLVIANAKSKAAWKMIAKAIIDDPNFVEKLVVVTPSGKDEAA